MSRQPGSFRAALLSSWALLLGFGILMLGDGLQGTLLAVRADLEGFSATICRARLSQSISSASAAVISASAAEIRAL